MEGKVLEVHLQGTKTVFTVRIGDHVKRITLNRPTNVRPGDSFSIEHVKDE